MKLEQGDLLPGVKSHGGDEDSNQRFTIPMALRWCKEKAQVTDYDLDAAACEESHHAPTWYGWKPSKYYVDPASPRLTPSGMMLDDGLELPWFGNTFFNPPWDNIYPWVMKAWREFTLRADRVREEAGLPALISITGLLPMRGHRPWWKELVEPFRDANDDAPYRHVAHLRSHHPPDRFAYGAPGNPLGVGVGEPNFTSVVLVWRR